MKLNLYLDDVRPAPPGWTRVHTVHEVMDFLRGGDVETLSLDHDLGACDSCIASDQNAAATLTCRHVPSGMDLVNWMVMSGFWPTKGCTVHSQNPVGASAMRRILRDYNQHL